jgi:hypothetical protein
MKRVLTLVAGAVAVTAGVALTLAAAEAKPRSARCVIDAAGAPRWSGACGFEAERGGSFTITPSRGSFQNGVASISLAIVRPGVGDVRGLTSAGVNSRWGEALRSPRDRACWIGADFSLCVY